MNRLTLMRVPEATTSHVGVVEVVDVDDDVKALAAAIGADGIEIYHRRIGPKWHMHLIICDEMGRIKKRKPTAFADNREGLYASFCGDILIGNECDNDVSSLEPEDILYLWSCIRPMNNGACVAPMLEVDR